LGSESETCVGSRVRLVGVFISFEKNFYRLPFTPPLSGSLYRSFTRPFVPITIVHPSFTSWWQELHDHIFNVPVHPLCLELMPDFHPISEVTNLFSLLYQWCPCLLIRIFAIFCRIQYLPLLPEQSPTTLQAQSLHWDTSLPPWLNWCLDMPHWIQLSSVQLLTKGKLHPWLLLQLPRRKEHPKEFLSG
jgi:hypothetical protein